MKFTRETPFSGWRADLEDRDWLRHNYPVLVNLRNRYHGDIDGYGELYTVEDPTVFDNPEHLAITENQANMGSCVGHGGTTAMEICWELAGLPRIALSRMYAYRASQLIAGINGDNGSTISAMTKLALRGVCLESTYTYPSRYSSSIPANAKAEAETGKYKCRKSLPIKSIADDQMFLGKRMGALIVGWAWKSSFDDQEIIEDVGGSLVGGHCVCIAALSPRRDRNGDYYSWVNNSWGKR